MNRLLTSTALIIALAACSGPTPAPPGVEPEGSSRPTAPVPVLQEITPTAAAIPSPAQQAPIWLQVVSPQDEAVLDTPRVDVVGSAPAGAVVSINDVILISGADGQFNTTLLLEEGPNLIEIVASNEAGDEAYLLLTVTYEP